MDINTLKIASEVKNFDNIKDKICCRFVSKERLADLSKFPHTQIADLYVAYHIPVGETENGKASVIINNELLAHYGITVKQLHDTAIRNLKAAGNATYQTIQDMLAHIMLPDLLNTMSEDKARAAIKEMIKQPPEGTPSMYILTNTDMYYGASMMLNTDIMDKILEEHPKGFVILPSSVHEVIILDIDTGEIHGDDLAQIVQEVNRKEVPDRIFLSNHVYVYPPDTKELTFYAA